MKCSILWTAAQAAALMSVLLGSARAQNDNNPPSGFKALFNGRDLTSWTGATTRDPRQIIALPPAERASHDATMKKAVAQHWRIEEDVLISDGYEPYLATTSDYGDFELWVDWQLGPGGDSGIYLRGNPQVQIWDPTNKAKFDRGADKGSGGLWNNERHERFPTKLADATIGQWNRMFIRMVGPYVTVILNGHTVVRNVVMENYYDRDRPVFERGAIYLQTHGSETRFRNIFVRELTPPESQRLLGEIDAVG
ncbi:MAG: DUF1080 domain-containing protein [Pirellulales bacterium]